MMHMQEGISYTLSFDVRPYTLDAQILECQYGVKWVKSVSFKNENVLSEMLEIVGTELVAFGTFGGRLCKSATLICKGVSNRGLMCRIELSGELYWNDMLVQFIQEVVKESFYAEFLVDFMVGLLYHPIELENEEVNERKGLTYVYGNKEIPAKRRNIAERRDRSTRDGGHVIRMERRDELRNVSVGD